MDPKEHETEKKLEASERHGPLLPKKLQALDQKFGKLELLMKTEKLIRISMYDKADLSRYLIIIFIIFVDLSPWIFQFQTHLKDSLTQIVRN